MNKTVRFLLLAGGAWLIYRYFRDRKIPLGVKPVQPLPQGAKFTGEMKRTTNAGAPGEEVVGYGVRDWAKITMPTGHEDWVEVRRK